MGITAIKATIPKSNVPGMNTKLLGRVKAVTNVKTAVEKTATAKDEVFKQPVEKEEIYEKVAAFSDIMKNGLSSAAKGGLGAAGALVGVRLASEGLDIASAAWNKPKYRAVLAKAIQLNPRLASYPADQLQRYYDVMISASPKISQNPLIVSNYLEYLIDHDGRLNFNAYETLAKVEGQNIDNYNNSHAFTNMAIKGLIEGSAKAATGSYFGGRVRP